jgi:phage terminase small subunit
MAAKLKLIDSSAGGPPRPLGPAGQALWRRICGDYDISDAAGVELLTLACEALDRAQACREVIDRHGVAQVHKDSGVIRENPLCKIELANRSYVAKQLERLGINEAPVKAIGKPPMTWSTNESKALKPSA